MQLDFDQNQPIYKQIMDAFRRRIARGDLQPGDRIPSQRELAQSTRVNPNTVQRAYREMEAAGLVETSRGQGTFVCDDPSMVERIRRTMAQEASASFVSEMRGLGFDEDAMIRWIQSLDKGGDEGYDSD